MPMGTPTRFHICHGCRSICLNLVHADTAPPDSDATSAAASLDIRDTACANAGPKSKSCKDRVDSTFARVRPKPGLLDRRQNSHRCHLGGLYLQRMTRQHRFLVSRPSRVVWLALRDCR